MREEEAQGVKQGNGLQVWLRMGRPEGGPFSYYALYWILSTLGLHGEGFRVLGQRRHAGINSRVFKMAPTGFMGKKANCYFFLQKIRGPFTPHTRACILTPPLMIRYITSLGRQARRTGNDLASSSNNVSTLSNRRRRFQQYRYIRPQHIDTLTALSLRITATN